MRVTILGCGGSGGVPLSNGLWGACDPSNPKNRRRRPSILIQEQGLDILVDTGPDMREQLIAAGCSKLDAVLYTHPHADHIHGIDDVRALNVQAGRVIDAYGNGATLSNLEARFSYVFSPIDHAKYGFYRPQLRAHVVESGPFEVGGLEIIAFPQDHYSCVSLGFRIGGFAYSTDVVSLDEHAFATLAGVDTWVVDALRETPHPAHAHLARTLSWIERLKPRRAILTHMNHDMDYETLHRKLPAGVEPGYDGMVIDL